MSASAHNRFILSLVPIAVGYTIAHYFSPFVCQGKAGYILAMIGRIHHLAS